MQNRAAPRRRNWLSSNSIPPGEDDGADEGGEEQDRHDLEGDEVGREDGVADSTGAARLADGLGRALQLAQLVVAEEVDEDVAEHAQEEECGDRRDAALVVVELALVAELGPGEHDAEQ